MCSFLSVDDYLTDKTKIFLHFQFPKFSLKPTFK